MSNFQVKCKLLFDFLISFCALLILFPIILIAWIFASIETRSNGFFFQKRVGQNGKLFMMIKIKTMRELDGFTSTVTTSDDIRIQRLKKIYPDTYHDHIKNMKHKSETDTLIFPKENTIYLDTNIDYETLKSKINEYLIFGLKNE